MRFFRYRRRNKAPALYTGAEIHSFFKDDCQLNLIVGDIIRTIIVDTSLQNVLILGLIVLIRVVLSFALEVEISGAWPWQQRRSEPAPPDAA